MWRDRQMSDWITQILSSKAEVGLAGFAGGLVATLVDWRGVLFGFRCITVGVLCAMWLTPLGVPLLKFILTTIQVDTDKAQGMSGFLMGVLGIVFIEFILHIFKVKLGKQSK